MSSVAISGSSGRRSQAAAWVASYKQRRRGLFCEPRSRRCDRAWLWGGCHSLSKSLSKPL
eukprot:927132-Prymnesium_polylepis.1